MKTLLDTFSGVVLLLVGVVLMVFGRWGAASS
jgi:hypothetical protein